MKPNFEAMIRTELRAYVLEHRRDIEAIRVLFRVPPGAVVKRFPPMVTQDGQPIEENIQIAEEAIRQKIEEIDRRHQDESDQQ